MRTHFISRLALLLTADCLVVAGQVWTGGTLQWLFVAGGAVMILIAAADAVREHVGQRALKWWSFASAVALAALSRSGSSSSA